MIARRATRKIITRAIMFIIAGAIVNVAVAWGCALLSPYGAGVTVLSLSMWADGMHLSYFHFDSAGWPVRSTAWQPNQKPFETTRAELLANKWPPQEPLPLLPLWPGFAINTIFYGAILWLLVAAPFAIRKRRRIKRGLCASCAYPTGTSDICTECGTHVKA